MILDNELSYRKNFGRSKGLAVSIFQATIRMSLYKLL